MNRDTLKKVIQVRMKNIINKIPCNYSLLIFAFLTSIILSGCRNEIDEEENVSWLDQNNLEIPSANIYDSDIDYSEIINAIGNSSIIGLGEATHGTTEFWGIRHKLTKYLIENKGYKAVLIEAPYPNMLFIDNYVYNQIGTLTEAHSKLGYWRYQEMLELISMISDYNISNPESKVHFYGYDCGFTKWTRAAEIVLSYLEKVDLNSIGLVSSYFETMNIFNAENILDLIESKRTEYIGLSSSEEYKSIYMISKNLPATVIHKELLNEGSYAMQYRDSINLGNLEFIMDSLLDSRKVIIWAHNAHISKGCIIDFDLSLSAMLGLRLKEKYGDQYFNICTEFFNGSFWSWDECEGHDFAFRIHNPQIPNNGYFSYYLNQSEKPIFFMNFNDLDISVTEADWLKNEKRIHVIGGTYCSEKDTGNYYSQKINITEYYDAIFFFKYTHPTTYFSNL